MGEYVILTDTSCDLSQEIRDFCGMDDYVKGHVSFSTGEDFPSSLDWQSITREDFYKTLSDKRVEVTTAPASPEEFYRIFKAYAERGIAVLSISLSSKISATYAIASSAAERVAAEMPGAVIKCVDSLRMSGALGLLVLYAHLLRKEGKSIDEVVAWLEENKRCVHQMGPIDDLKFVARRGRISMGKAIMGSFAGVKPMGDCTADGYVSILTKVKGMKKALDVTVRYVEKTAIDIENRHIIISHSNRAEYAQTLKELLESALHPKTVFVSDVFTGSGPNIGPGMVGVYYLGAPVSADQSVEKETMAAILAETK